MNFFFSFKNNFIQSRLTIPRFTNFGKRNKFLKVFEATTKNNLWNINVVNCDFNEDFYFINEDYTNNTSIFFLAQENDIELIKKNNYSKLINFNDFTETSPVAYRSNLKIILKNGGFSSYQSEYPFSMIEKRGSILSPINNLLNINNDINIILIKNIFIQPSNVNFNLFFIDLIKKKILKQHNIQTNTTNEIIVEPSYINPNVYIFTDNYVGVPIFIGIKNNHISLEHTHPLHHYILSDDRFKKITEIKKKIYDIINS